MILIIIATSLENIDDNSQKKQKEKRKQSKESAKNINKKLKTESGIFVGYCETPPELKVTEKKERKKNKVVKKECIDEVDSVESMKEVERKLWLTCYGMSSEKLMEVVRENSQMNEPNRLGHETLFNVFFRRASEPMLWRSVQMCDLG